ncbi:hypothetical protein PTSG_09485 [Salpingoeca rosetta]|uniref:Uncharacterized protein n=1 Tax=Salpingoeca rosetta (strain ATCC 50818 / BSB-021) TaxID=946362 RepID=F2UL53_SALR5|nr:uncharacterized protein PTSG_09485 [Salpingoeca rosetta]EGD77852.1 hypothetical protein PTSG_09485 [Salpingoeca rosetta]|eukprot:XP_004989916.1 hypothetical protein PTSG_09485 [Salpingoeca rosetta]
MPATASRPQSARRRDSLQLGSDTSMQTRTSKFDFQPPPVSPASKRTVRRPHDNLRPAGALSRNTTSSEYGSASSTAPTSPAASAPQQQPSTRPRITRVQSGRKNSASPLKKPSSTSAEPLLPASTKQQQQQQPQSRRPKVKRVPINRDSASRKSSQSRPRDNLRFEGERERETESSQYRAPVSGERQGPVRHRDSLVFDGQDEPATTVMRSDFGAKGTSERATPSRARDNLRFEGERERETESSQYRAPVGGERQGPVRHRDSLVFDGQDEPATTVMRSDFGAKGTSERATPSRARDNLRFEGERERETESSQYRAPVGGERQGPVRHRDSLVFDGQDEPATTVMRSDFGAKGTSERATPSRARDSLRFEGERERETESSQYQWPPSLTERLNDLELEPVVPMSSTPSKPVEVSFAAVSAPAAAPAQAQEVEEQPPVVEPAKPIAVADDAPLIAELRSPINPVDSLAFRGERLNESTTVTTFTAPVGAERAREGELERSTTTKETFVGVSGERPAAYGDVDHLVPEAGARVEGASTTVTTFTAPVGAERPKSARRADTLTGGEGELERSTTTKETFVGVSGERPAAYGDVDHLVPEEGARVEGASTTVTTFTAPVGAERPKSARRADTLRGGEGELERSTTTKETFVGVSGERPAAYGDVDHLVPEEGGGEDELERSSTTKETFVGVSGERPAAYGDVDHLVPEEGARVEGASTTVTTFTAPVGAERPKSARRADTLRGGEGELERSPTTKETFVGVSGERPAGVRRVEGASTTVTTFTAPVGAERPKSARRADTLTGGEGELERSTTTKETFVGVSGERPAAYGDVDHLVPEEGARVEGASTTVTTFTAPVGAERPKSARRADTLRGGEGELERSTSTKETFVGVSGERPAAYGDVDHLVPEEGARVEGASTTVTTFTAPVGAERPKSARRADTLRGGEGELERSTTTKETFVGVSGERPAAYGDVDHLVPEEGARVEGASTTVTTFTAPVGAERPKSARRADTLRGGEGELERSTTTKETFVGVSGERPAAYGDVDHLVPEEGARVEGASTTVTTFTAPVGAERPKSARRADTLRGGEGELERSTTTKETFVGVSGERPAAYGDVDHLVPEEGARVEGASTTVTTFTAPVGAERPKSARRADTLRGGEGELERSTTTKETFVGVSGERPAAYGDVDHLVPEEGARVEGASTTVTTFTAPVGAERPKSARRADTLRGGEGELERSTTTKETFVGVSGERPAAYGDVDHLVPEEGARVEGASTTVTTFTAPVGAERPKSARRADTLRGGEGELERSTTTKETFVGVSGERPAAYGDVDHLVPEEGARVEGASTTVTTFTAPVGAERPKSARRADTLRGGEGELERSTTTKETFVGVSGERPAAYGDVDHLVPEEGARVEGASTTVTTFTAPVGAERPKSARRADTLRGGEGELERSTTTKETFVGVSGERPAAYGDVDHLVPEAGARVEGASTTVTTFTAPVGAERPKSARRADTLTGGEGELERSTTTKETFVGVSGERPAAYGEGARVEGASTTVTTFTAPVGAERPKSARRADTLRGGEGELERSTTTKETFVGVSGERPAAYGDVDHLVPEEGARVEGASTTVTTFTAPVGAERPKSARRADTLRGGEGELERSTTTKETFVGVSGERPAAYGDVDHLVPEEGARVEGASTTVTTFTAPVGAERPKSARRADTLRGGEGELERSTTTKETFVGVSGERPAAYGDVDHLVPEEGARVEGASTTVTTFTAPVGAERPKSARRADTLRGGEGELERSTTTKETFVGVSGERPAAYGDVDHLVPEEGARVEGASTTVTTFTAPVGAERPKSARRADTLRGGEGELERSTTTKETFVGVSGERPAAYGDVDHLVPEEGARVEGASTTVTTFTAPVGAERPKSARRADTLRGGEGELERSTTTKETFVGVSGERPAAYGDVDHLVPEEGARVEGASTTVTTFTAPVGAERPKSARRADTLRGGEGELERSTTTKETFVGVSGERPAAYGDVDHLVPEEGARVEGASTTVTTFTAPVGAERPKSARRADTLRGGEGELERSTTTKETFVGVSGERPAAYGDVDHLVPEEGARVEGASTTVTTFTAPVGAERPKSARRADTLRGGEGELERSTTTKTAYRTFVFVREHASTHKVSVTESKACDTAEYVDLKPINFELAA